MKRHATEDGFEQWGGYMNAKITKLEEQYAEAAASTAGKLSNIFSGVAIFVNGYTSPSADQLRLLMLQHGGIYHHYERSETTHVIATNLPNAKMKLIKSSKYVKPEWITESIAAGKLLDYKQYILFTNSALQPSLNFKSISNEPSSSTHAKTAVDPKFLSEFYNNSRLHHIATMGAMFKQYVNELQQKHDGYFPGRDRFKNWEKVTPYIGDNGKVIMHIDMDCFFVSVALKNHPELVGHPVAVTHAKGNPTHQRAGADPEFEYNYYFTRHSEKQGSKSEKHSDVRAWSKGDSMAEIASCSYEAREAGVKNGMLLGTALKLCPNLKTASYDFEGYKEVSFALYNTIAEYTLQIEAVSCDELFVDCTELLSVLKCKPLELVEFLRNELKDKTKCPSSAGLGSNKLLARLATKRAKPNGQFWLEPDQVAAYMLDINVKELPGVGSNINHKLKSLGVATCKDLQDIRLDILQKELGNKNGETLYKHCRGEDTREVKTFHQRKSVSAEVNYGIRFTVKDEAYNFFKQLSEEVSNRLKEVKMKGKCVTLKLLIRSEDAPLETAKFMGHGICDAYTKSVSTNMLFDEPSVILKYIIQIYDQTNIPPSELRGIGVQITKLEECKSNMSLTNFLTNVTKPSASTKKPNMAKEVFQKQINSKIQKPLPHELDVNVLNSLPEDIRSEILAEYNLTIDDLIVRPGSSKESQPDSSNQLSMSQIDNSVLEALPDDIKQEIKASVKQRQEKKTSKLWNSLSVKELRQLIGQWVSSESNPQDCDINMLVDYLHQLILNKDLENLNVVLNCLRRHVIRHISKAPVWESVFKLVVDQVQVVMVQEYKAKLKVDELV